MNTILKTLTSLFLVYITVAKTYSLHYLSHRYESFIDYISLDYIAHFMGLLTIIFFLCTLWKSKIKKYVQNWVVGLILLYSVSFQLIYIGWNLLSQDPEMNCQTPVILSLIPDITAVALMIYFIGSYLRSLSMKSSD